MDERVPPKAHNRLHPLAGASQRCRAARVQDQDRGQDALHWPEACPAGVTETWLASIAGFGQPGMMGETSCVWCVCVHERVDLLCSCSPPTSNMLCNPRQSQIFPRSFLSCVLGEAPFWGPGSWLFASRCSNPSAQHHAGLTSGFELPPQKTAFVAGWVWDVFMGDVKKGMKRCSGEQPMETRHKQYFINQGEMGCWKGGKGP